MTLGDVRCLCNRLLFKGEAKHLEIKCPNCKRLYLIKGSEMIEVSLNGKH